jgi:hypothetical protein
MHLMILEDRQRNSMSLHRHRHRPIVRWLQRNIVVLVELPKHGSKSHELPQNSTANNQTT